MTIEITQLPRIVETLAVDGARHFVVLAYNEFIQLAAASAVNVPDVVAVLDHGDEHAFVVLHFNDFSIYVKTLNIVGSVDERHYLATHPDVKAAIERGHLPSGTHHYIIAGYYEGRAAKYLSAGQ